METNTYRFNSTWFWHHLDPILCNDFSCRSESMEKPILAVTDPAISRKHNFGKSKLSRMDINPKRISQGDGSQNASPKYWKDTL